jgi:hypothetical protein
MIATVIQTVAAVIQAAAAILFFKTVRDAAKLKEQTRRDNIVHSLHDVWCRTGDNITPEEQSGCPFSQRQIGFFNSRIREMGETWSFLFERI